MLFKRQKKNNLHIEFAAEICVSKAIIYQIMAGQPTPPNVPPPRNKALINKGLWKPIGFP